MKYNASWLLVPSLALSLWACKKNDEAQLPDPTATAEVVPGEVTAPPVEKAVPPRGMEERAAKLGFVQHLPQDTEVVLGYYNGKKTAARLTQSKIWNLVQEQMGGGMGMFAPGDIEMEIEDEDLDMLDAEQDDSLDLDDPADDGPAGPAMLFGSEFMLALGKTSGVQTGHLMTLYSRVGYFQMRKLAKSFADAVKSGDDSSFSEALEFDYGPELSKDLLSDPESGLTLLEKAAMPPIYMAFRTSTADRASAAQQIAAMVENLGFLGDMVEPVSVEQAGNTFEGYKVSGSKISASMAEGRESMEEDLDAATVDQLLAILAKKDLVVLSGTVGDYVLLFIGASADALQLAAAPGQSMVANESLAFSDAYASKELAALVYGQKEAMDTLIATSSGLVDMTRGLRDGIAATDGLGDTRDLEAMFQIVADRELALRKLVSNEATGTVAYFEEGLKIESYGGSDSGMINWSAPNKLAHLGDSQDVVLFMNATSDVQYSEKSRAYLEALMETGYALTMKVVEAPLKSQQMAGIKEMVTTFDTKFRPEMVALWDAFGDDLGAGLGYESAFVIDLKGSPPSLPGISQPVLDKVKIPRISWVAPVTDRTRLAGSWDKMNLSLTGTLAKISEMTGMEIPMQKPISSERNGNISWFIAVPFLTDDFLPSVTVSDAWFAASTSKNHALDLIDQATTGGESRPGVWFQMNFRALQKYAEETYKLADKHAEELTGTPLDANQKKIMDSVVAIMDELDKLTIHIRREAAVLRSSVHFKTR